MNNKTHKTEHGQDPTCTNKYGLRMLDKCGAYEVCMTLENRHPFIESNPKNKATDDNYLRLDFIFLDTDLATRFYNALKDNKLKFVERYTGPIQEEDTIVPRKDINGNVVKESGRRYYEQKPKWPSHTLTGGRP